VSYELDDDWLIIRDMTLVDEVIDLPNVRQWVIIQSVIQGVTFKNVKAENFSFGAGMRPTTYRNCVFSDCEIRSITPGRATFVGCTFENVDLFRLIFREVEMVDCTFSGVMKDVVFDRRVQASDRIKLGRIENIYSGNDFSRVKLIDVSFRGGVQLDAQILPVGDGYIYIADAERELPKLIENVRVADPESRLLTYLKVCLDHVDGGQRSVLLSPYDRARRGKAGELLANLYP
jgi:hypothetical protein